MTDQALDKLMRQVLIDSLALEEDSAEPVNFNSSKRHEQQMQLMLKNPLGWYKRKTKPVWKLALQRVAVVFLVASIGFGKNKKASRKSPRGRDGNEKKRTAYAALFFCSVLNMFIA